ncbi:MAG TPA: TIGR03435 family protein [Vicinamibacterales bacterium]|nr:TIGR03435 family protein [Vicinamibacterales bacterium]
MKRIAVLVGVGLVVAIGHAQSSDQEPVAFEVASIKPTKTQGTSLLLLYPGRLSITNTRVAGLIMRAYRLQAEQLAGGPSWINSEAFDIEARAPGNVSSDQLMLMLRTLLTDRFQLTLRHETRELPVYTLTMARANGQLGPKLTRSAESNCARPPRPGEVQKDAPSDPTAPRCGLFSPLGHWTGRGTTIDALAAQLSAQSLHRVVVNDTHLTGTFDLDLQWADLAFLFSPQANRNDPPLTDGPSLVTALQEQLGLKLESAKAPVDVLVIDHIERPTPD